MYAKMRARVLLGIAKRFVHTEVAPGISGPQSGSPKNRVFRLTAAGFGVGTVVGLGYGYEQYRKVNRTVLNKEDDITYVLKELPPILPSKKVKYASSPLGLKFTIFQYQTCPFCCKVRALLDYFGISYDIVEVNPVLRTQLKWSQKYRKVPILIVQTAEGQVYQLNDSSMIVSCLYSLLFAKKSREQNDEGETLKNLVKCYPVINSVNQDGKNEMEIMNKYFLMLDTEMGGRSKEQITEERKWRRWADNVYVHTLSPNIYRTISEAIDSFKYFDKVGEWDKNFSNWERTLVIYVGALAMWIIGKRLQRKYHLNDDVRQSLYDESNFWMSAIKKKNKGIFMGGENPDLSDLAVYGVLSSIEGCDAFSDLKKHSKIVSEWYSQMKSSMQKPLKSNSSVQ